MATDLERIELSTLRTARQFSSGAVALAIILSVVFSASFGPSSMGWQVVIALVALAIGIPHGALDHLVTLPKSAPLKMAFFILGYVAIAIIAVGAILRWNTVGFILVVAMSAIHFGIGDAAFISEIKRRDGDANDFPRFLYATTAGALPVVIPLVSQKSTEALAQVNPDLIDWHHGSDQILQTSVIVIAAITAVALLVRRRNRDLFDISLLVGLAFIAPPLVAFAIYFGCWHAVRHTARLSLVLPSSQRAFALGKGRQAIAKAILPGLPALIGTFVAAAIAGQLTGGEFSDRFLWFTLVIVWALTVPHMAVTAKLDRKALSR